MKKFQDQSGVTLLLAIVMTMVLLAGATIIATLAIRQSRVSGTTEKGIVAYYGTESAVEKAIYEVFKNGADPLTLDGQTGTFGDGGLWEQTAKDRTDTVIIDFLPAGLTEQINLYNTDNSNSAAGVSAFNFNWSTGSELSIDISAWDGSTLGNPSTTTLTCSSSPCSGILPLNPGLAYLLKITASGTSASDIIATTEPAGTLIQIPITVEVNGTYQGARKAVQLTLPIAPPWDAPLPTEVCGNGIPEGVEQCDDGNTTPGDGCSDICQIEAGPSCGDGNLDIPAEQCDDGNLINGDGCSNTCLIEVAPSCGDGNIDLPAEQCDDGLANSDTTPNACRVNCLLPVCSDGVTDNLSGEQCDDGNLINGDGCDSTCQAEVVAAVCGDGNLDAGEQCDDGGANSDSTPDACRTNCTLPVCGDNVTDSGEQCDGTSTNITPAFYNSIVSDACSPSCQYNQCMTAVFDDSTAGLNVSPVIGVSYDYYINRLSMPSAEGNVYSSMTNISPFSGTCYNNCTNFSSDSGTPFVDGTNVWTVYWIGHWPWPVVVSPTPSIHYDGTQRFCKP